MTDPLMTAREALEAIVKWDSVYGDTLPDRLAKQIREARQALATLNATPARSAGEAVEPIHARPDFRCKARSSYPDPADCDWPQCGCDPVATRVLDNIIESGFKIVRDHPSAGAPSRESGDE